MPNRIDGTVGDDTITGTPDPDAIYGLDGNDVLSGGAGADTIYGGPGDDTITDDTGEDYIVADTGNDHLILHVTNGIGRAFGGEGDDVVDISVDGNLGSYYVSLNEGNDTINFGAMNTGGAALKVIGWTGSDTYRFTADYTPSKIIMDFRAGAGGDVIDIMPFINAYLATHSANWIAGTDPFEAGYLRLTQNGTEATLWFLPEGPGSPRTAIATMQGCYLGSLIADNFSGLNFQAGIANNETRVFSGYYTVDPGTVIDVVNPQGFGQNAFGESSATQYETRPLFFYMSNIGGFTNYGDVSVRVTSPLSGAGVPGVVIGFQTSELINNLTGSAEGPLFLNAAGSSFTVDNLYPHVDGVKDGLAYGFYALSRGQSVDFRNDGYFSVSSAVGEARGIYHLRDSRAFTNTGTFNVSCGDTAFGVLSGYDSDTFINSGSFTVSGDEAYGVYVGGWTSHFDNSGTIAVTGQTYAEAVHFNGYLYADAFHNSGTITATVDAGSPYASIGLYLAESDAPLVGGSAFHIYNSGTITADIAIFIQNDHSTFHQGREVVHNSGTIDGAVMLSFGADIVENSGTMNGRTILGYGNDRYDGSLGRHNGTVEAGGGNDVLIGGVYSDTFFGDVGNDTLTGGDGDDYLDGGYGSDRLDGGAGFDIVSFAQELSGVTVNLATGYASDGINRDTLAGFEEVIGSRYDDDITGSSDNDVLVGGGGQDRLVGGGGDDVLRGEKGSDTMTGGIGNDRFLFGIGDGHDTITDYTTGDSIEVYGYSAIQSVNQSGADVVITLSTNDTITVLGTTTAEVLAGLAWTPAKLPSVVVDDDVPLIFENQDVVIREGADFAIINPADVDFYRGDYDANGIVLASTDIVLWSNMFNAGSFSLRIEDSVGIATGVTSTRHYGSLYNTVVNLTTGTIDVTSLQGSAIGVSGTFEATNLGVVRVSSQAGDAIGFTDLQLTSGWNGNGYRAHFTNAGLIEVEATGQATGLGQWFSSGSSPEIYNSGAILVSGGGGSAGINYHPSISGVLVNSGVISVSDHSGAKDSAGLLVDWSTQTVEVWNSGLIEGNYSIKRSYTYTGGYGELRIYNSGQLIGDIDLVYPGPDPDSPTRTAAIFNTGLIQGNVLLTENADIFDGRGGTLVGRLDGAGGDDQLLAGAGDNVIFGGDGNDLLSGGAGADSLTGGSGADTFRYEAGFGIDVITDFKPGEGDRIEVRGYASWSSISQVGADVVIAFGAGDQLILKNFAVANVDVGSFVFGAPEIALNSILSAPVAPDVSLVPASLAGSIFAPLLGGMNSDNLTGTAGRDFLIGLSGNDRLSGDAGDDRLNGGIGNDVLDGGAGADDMDGEDGNDVYILNVAADHATAEIDDTGSSGTDEVRFAATGASTLTLFAGDRGIERVVIGTGTGVNAVTSGTVALNVNAAAVGNALVMIGNNGANVLTGTAFNDRLTGLSGDDVLRGGLGNDTLDGGAGVDRMYGGLGDDTFIVSDATDYAYEYAGEGTDLVLASVTTRIRDFIENLTLTGGSNINGTGNALDNTIRGNEAGNALSGMDGADLLYGNGGSDVLDGGAGDDKLFGGDGDDTLTGGAGLDRLYGGLGDDSYIVTDDQDFAYENAGEGYDQVFSSIDLQLRDNVEMLTLTGAAAIGKGNALDNLIVGTDGGNRLYGYDGDDRLEGNGGDDYLVGGAGNDVLVAGSGYDRLFGGTGDDVYYATDRTTYVYENAGEGNDRVVSSVTMVLRPNVEELVLTGTDALRGYGNELSNQVIGNEGANQLYGYGGADHLAGGGGNDVLDGGEGGDLIEGGAGTDRFYGGAGADTFLFRDGDFGGLSSSTADRIHDFSQAEGDRIRLDLVDANVNLAGDQAFSFIGSSAFHGIAGELRAVQQSGVTYVMGDTNGDGQADFWIRLDGLHTLSNNDFVL